MNIEVNLIFLIKPFFLHDQKAERKGLSVKQITQFFLDCESPTLRQKETKIESFSCGGAEIGGENNRENVNKMGTYSYISFQKKLIAYKDLMNRNTEAKRQFKLIKCYNCDKPANNSIMKHINSCPALSTKSYNCQRTGGHFSRYCKRR